MTEPSLLTPPNLDKNSVLASALRGGLVVNWKGQKMRRIIEIKILNFKQISIEIENLKRFL